MRGASMSGAVRHQRVPCARVLDEKASHAAPATPEDRDPVSSAQALPAFPSHTRQPPGAALLSKIFCFSPFLEQHRVLLSCAVVLPERAASKRSGSGCRREVGRGKRGRGKERRRSDRAEKGPK
eukprot:3931696-Rhodomonas_salina.2